MKWSGRIPALVRAVAGFNKENLFIFFLCLPNLQFSYYKDNEGMLE